jgi:hypothetical protein
MSPNRPIGGYGHALQSGAVAAVDFSRSLFWVWARKYAPQRGLRSMDSAVPVLRVNAN